jgi:tRNA nucleotidyltransferase (CCA-adding enzyme)
MSFTLPSQVNKAISLLSQAGFEAFVVGGCVRDSLLGASPADWDITTSALPEETERVFEGYRIIETGLKHGTVTVLVDKVPLEITTYRIDGKYSDNRHPDSVSFTRNLRDDLSRRDFTINALAYNSEKGIVDCFGGTQDIENGIIRCVGDADARFNEDALRILRAVRFSSVLGFEIDAKTSESIFRNKMLLNNIAPERIRVELMKLLNGKDVRRVLLEYRDIIAVFIPELIPCFDYPQNTPYHCYDVYTHTAYTVEAAPAEFRIAMLLHDIAKPECRTTDGNGIDHFKGHPQKSAEKAYEILKRLRYDNATIDKTVKFIAVHDEKLPHSLYEALKLLKKIGEDGYKYLITAKYADNQGKADKHSGEELLENMAKYLAEINEKQLCYSIKQLDVTGNDLIKAGFTEGRKIGQALDMLVDAVIDGRVENKKEELLKYILK